MTFDQYWRIVAKALNASEPHIVHIPTDLLKAMLPKRAEWCAENFQHVTIFDNEAAHKDLGFRYTISWEQGIRTVIEELDRRELITNSKELTFYDRLLGCWEEHTNALIREIRPYDLE